LNIHRFSDVRQIEIYTTEPLVPDPSPLKIEIAITKLKRYKLPGSDQIPTELIQTRGETLWSEIFKVINSVWNKEELPDQWKESIVPIYKKSNKTECSNYLGISLLSTSYIVLSNILPSRLSPYIYIYIYEIIWDHKCGFQLNRSTTDQILCILEKKWE
jgi:hypothetical protein